MIACTVLFLLGSLFTDVVAGSSPIFGRQANETERRNPFASITPSKQLSWVPCYQDSEGAKLGPISCARLITPLDYDDASRGDIQLAIIKLGGSGYGQKKRTVFLNIGGPGGNPVDFITGGRVSFSRAQVGNDSDIIAVVGRGVASTFPPITCDATEEIASQRSQAIAEAKPGTNDTALETLYGLAKDLGRDCGRVTPDLIPYAGTFYVAKDMNHVLQALKQDKISYLGYSYGSVLGATFAALFPDKIDRMVLDGVLDFNNWYESVKKPEADIGDTDAALSSFFQFCFDAGPEKCAFWYGSPKEIEKRFFEADRRLLEKSLPIPGFGQLTAGRFRGGVWDALYRPESFPLLAGVTSEIYNGTVGPAVKSYVEFLQQQETDPPLVDNTTGLQNSENAYNWIVCSDTGSRGKDLDKKDLEALYKRYTKVSKYFAGVSSQLEIICAGANIPAKERYRKKFENIKTSTPILFIANTVDPTTPRRNAVSMTKNFPGSTLLTIKGTGHISYTATRDAECAMQWIQPYFKDGTLPPPGTVCDGKQAPFG